MNNTTTQSLHGLYTLLRQDGSQGQIYAQIQLHADHAVYRGHFPEQPITPGVCLLEMIKSILAAHLQKRVVLICCKHMKFIKLIDPTAISIINFYADCQYFTDRVIAKVIVKDSDSQIYCKFLGTFSY